MINKKTRQEVLERDSFDGCPCCIYCGKPSISGSGLHLHHVIRRSQGGANVKENLVTLCYGCHMKLHDGASEIQDYCENYLRRMYE